MSLRNNVWAYVGLLGGVGATLVSAGSCPSIEGLEARSKNVRVVGTEKNQDCEYVETGDLPWPVGRLRMVWQSQGQPALFSDLCGDATEVAGETLVHNPGRASLVRIRLHGDANLEAWEAAAKLWLAPMAKQSSECRSDLATAQTKPGPGTAAKSSAPKHTADMPPRKPTYRPSQNDVVLPPMRRNAQTSSKLFTLGQNTYYGRNGSRKNHHSARQSYQVSAAHGNTKSQYMLAYMLSKGQGGTKDVPRAIYWAYQAAMAGHGDAASFLGNLYYFARGVPKDYVEAAKWYKIGAKKENGSSLYSLGFISQYGQGVPKNVVKAFQYYTRGAKAGNVSAMEALGSCYRNGIGTGKNPKAAKTWFSKAAKKGNSEALLNLASMYEKGEGGRSSLVLAKTMYRQAARKNVKKAQEWLKARNLRW